MIQKEFARSKDQTQYHIPFLLEGAVFGEWERFFWLKGTCLSKVKQSLQRPSDFQKMPRKIMEEISGQANDLFSEEWCLVGTGLERWQVKETRDDERRFHEV